MNINTWILQSTTLAPLDLQKVKSPFTSPLTELFSMTNSRLSINWASQKTAILQVFIVKPIKGKLFHLRGETN